jgi:hypothetical protein
MNYKIILVSKHNNDGLLYSLLVFIPLKEV